jgi:hypothetical protein
MEDFKPIYFISLDPKYTWEFQEKNKKKKKQPLQTAALSVGSLWDWTYTKKYLNSFQSGPVPWADLGFELWS